VGENPKSVGESELEEENRPTESSVGSMGDSKRRVEYTPHSGNPLTTPSDHAKTPATAIQTPDEVEALIVPNPEGTDKSAIRPPATTATTTTDLPDRTPNYPITIAIPQHQEPDGDTGIEHDADSNKHAQSAEPREYVQGANPSAHDPSPQVVASPEKRDPRVSACTKINIGSNHIPPNHSHPESVKPPYRFVKPPPDTARPKQTVIPYTEKTGLTYLTSTTSSPEVASTVGALEEQWETHALTARDPLPSAGIQSDGRRNTCRRASQPVKWEC
jgi:hypothetical protein